MLSFEGFLGKFHQKENPGEKQRLGVETKFLFLPGNGMGYLKKEIKRKMYGFFLLSLLTLGTELKQLKENVWVYK